jgi:hypothetical protein
MPTEMEPPMVEGLFQPIQLLLLGADRQEPRMLFDEIDKY